MNNHLKFWKFFKIFEHADAKSGIEFGPRSKKLKTDIIIRRNWCDTSECIEIGIGYDK